MHWSLQLRMVGASCHLLNLTGHVQTIPTNTCPAADSYGGFGNLGESGTLTVLKA